jgi:hypothetical protein
MAIIGDHPEQGIRFVLERAADVEKPPFRYIGSAFTPTDRHRLDVVVAEDGAVSVDSDGPPDLQEKARLLVRTLVRHAEAEGNAPPRRILRWRPN